MYLLVFILKFYFGGRGGVFKCNLHLINKFQVLFPSKYTSQYKDTFIYLIQEKSLRNVEINQRVFLKIS
jgi:hypothetical protein